MGIKDREAKRASIVEKMTRTMEESLQQTSSPIATTTETKKNKNAPAASTILMVTPKKEAKTKRVNAVLPPSLHAAAVAKCKEVGISLNDCIAQLLAIWVAAD